jgi:hypothetical protein
MKLLCERDPKVFTRSYAPNANDLLTMAAQHHHAPIIHYLLRQGVNPNVRSTTGRTPLSQVFRPVLKDDDISQGFSNYMATLFEALTPLLRHTNDPTSADRLGYTLLTRAMEFDVPRERATTDAVDAAINACLGHILEDIANRESIGDVSTSISTAASADPSGDDSVLDAEGTTAVARVRGRCFSSKPTTCAEAYAVLMNIKRQRL